MTLRVELRERGEKKRFPKTPTDLFTIPTGTYNLPDLKELYPSIRWDDIFFENTRMIVSRDRLNIQGGTYGSVDIHIGNQIGFLGGIGNFDMELIGESKELRITETDRIDLYNYPVTQKGTFQVRMRNGDKEY